LRKILEKISPSGSATLSVSLPHAERQKSRGLLSFADGSEAALLLTRGSVLRDGDRLLAEDGAIIAVEAALEEVSVVVSSNQRELMRAAYHLGNRHVALQIEATRLVYLHDHVLDALVRELGLRVSVTQEPFEPESGAYSHAHEARARSRQAHADHESP
jgi:urease accessory protein